MKNKQNAISLIELMLTVSILSIGLVFILRSFFTVIGALNYAQNKIAAVYLLDAEMAALKETALTEKNFTEGIVEKTVNFEGKNFSCRTESFYLLDEKQIKIEDLKATALSIGWEEAGKTKEEKIISYFKINNDGE